MKEGCKKGKERCKMVLSSLSKQRAKKIEFGSGLVFKSN